MLSPRDSETGSRKIRLRRILGGVFLAVAIPTALLIRQAFSQLEADAYLRQDSMLRELMRGIEQELAWVMAEEDGRPFEDYGFRLSASATEGPSPLSAFPVTGRIPGLIGYFQVDDESVLSTPLLPATDVDMRSLGVSAENEAGRRALQQQVAAILAENSLSGRSGPAFQRSDPEVSASGLDRDDRRAESLERRAGAGILFDDAGSQSAKRDASVSGTPAVRQSVFDALLEEGAGLATTARVQEQEAALAPRREQAASAEENSVAALGAAARRIDTFANEIEPLRFSRLDSGEFVLFRNAWREGRRFVQGALIEGRPFVQELIGVRFGDFDLGDAIVRFAGRPMLRLTAGSAGPTTGELATFARTERLPPPFAEIELAFASSGLPASPARTVLVWVSLILTLVLPGAFLVIYRMLAGQVELNQQQRDFVSAVSHELKTPLTSIRMYGEMLRSGWADEGRKRTYYDYIYDESERLTRLIDNVLALARVGRGEAALHLEDAGVSELLDLTRSRVATLAEAAGFEIEWSVGERVTNARLRVDKDAFTQIMINLIDNAIKYSGSAAQQRIRVEARRQEDGRIAFCVRDYGPGVPRGRLKKLFELFYRPHDEVTRAVPGTGIGLALVNGLTRGMGGNVAVRDCKPGAEFQVILPEEGTA